MPKLSAGILIFKLVDNKLIVLLVHPGGPFWKNKDNGAWSIPKGEYDEGEDALAAAKRELKEETGLELQVTEFLPLSPVKIKSGKVITAWAAQTEVDTTSIQSNQFEMEWPPRSGKRKMFPEVDKAGWFTIEEAQQKISAGQVAILLQLKEMILK